MLKIKLEKIVNAQESLARLLTKELPVKTSYRLSRIVSKVNSELKQFHKTRDELIKKYGNKDEGDNYAIDPDDKANREKFEKDIKEILDVEVELSGFSPISIDELSGVKISALDLANLEDFINADD